MAMMMSKTSELIGLLKAQCHFNFDQYQGSIRVGNNKISYKAKSKSKNCILSLLLEFRSAIYVHASRGSMLVLKAKIRP